VKTAKSIAAGACALAVVGGAAAGMACVAAQPGPAQLGLASFGAPLPQDPAPTLPAADTPSADQLTGLLNSLADPSVPFANKSNLVEGGISGTVAHVADSKIKKAAKNGDLPLTFDVSNIQPGASGSATADVAVSGPKLTNPVTQSLTFVNQGSWMLSRSSAMALLQAVGEH
jgi:hypothetical protein